MAQILDQPRYKCALAAMQTVHAIPRAIPILHAGPGCGSKLNDNSGVSGYYSPNIFPSTNIGEKEVVFGGEGKLRTTIENALKIIDADLFVVLTGCTAEIVGDDAGEVVREFADAAKPVICVNTPGFKGSNYQGHDWVLSAIFDQYLPDGRPPVNERQANIFLGPPVQDPFWHGNLKALESLLREIGLEPNMIFGYANGVSAVDRIPAGAFNILVSPWVGLDSVRLLEEKYGAPCLHYPVLPIGAAETGKFLRAVGKFANLGELAVERVISEHEKEYYYFIERYADTFLELRILSKRFVVIADAQYAIAVTKFLVNDLGWNPGATQFITDNTPKEHREGVGAEFERLNYGIKAPVEFSTNGFEIQKKIKESGFTAPPMIFGSSWDKAFAKGICAPFLNITYPTYDRLVINGGLAGYAGGLKFLEDIYTTAMQTLIL
jgi:nitrogenase molybdenum-iron protein beta chain